MEDFFDQPAKTGMKNGRHFIKCDWWFELWDQFPHKLLLTDTQVSRIRSLANVKFSKTQLFKLVQLW